MTEAIPFSCQADLVDAVRSILRHSEEPLTLPRIRERLPEPFRGLRAEELAEVLQRQVAAHVLVMCPKYRSAQDRYWDRCLRDHAKVRLREALRDGPVPLADLRKKFPKYMRHLSEAVLSEELARKTVFRHPPISPRMGPRYALQPAEIRAYAGKALRESLGRLEELGFDRADARETIMQMLQEEEWAEYAADARAGSAPSTTEPTKQAATIGER